MNPFINDIAITERRLLALDPDQHDRVSETSAATSLELSAARAAVARAAATGRLDQAEAGALANVLSRWNVASMAERVVCWRALHEIAVDKPTRAQLM